MKKPYLFIKRIFDIILALLLGLILSPLLLVLTISVYFNLGSPVIYTQNRPGKKEKIFKMYKFRSMTNERNKYGDLLPDKDRLTKFGLFIRKASLDELPEIWNVLKGDMSFIGPRPLSIHYLPFYDDEEIRRHDVRPGLSGLAQVNGRNNAPWPQRMADDLYYVDHISFLLDIKIFLKTILKVVKQSDIKVRSDNSIKNFNVYKAVKEGEKMASNRDLEIGSEFEYDDSSVKESEQSVYDYLIKRPGYEDHQFTISGRNAIGLILDDILTIQDVHSAYVPSYACISMIQPFLDRNINIKYYDVHFSDEGIIFSLDQTKKVDVFLYMEYFGFDTDKTNLENILRYYASNNTLIIQDLTHNLFNKESIKMHADYSIISLRKWFALASGGIAYKANNLFYRKVNQSSDDIVTSKYEAMKLKKIYLEGNDINKSDFLKKFADFNNQLIRLDDNLTIDTYSLNYLKTKSYQEIINKRKRNSKFLYNSLVTNDGVRFLFKDLKDNEVPLFVPLVVDETQRDNLRKFLIEHHVYLPVHWPERLSEKTSIPNVELSLIVDQRYQEKQLENMIDLINSWNKDQLNID